MKIRKYFSQEKHACLHTHTHMYAHTSLFVDMPAPPWTKFQAMPLTQHMFIEKLPGDLLGCTRTYEKLEQMQHVFLKLLSLTEEQENQSNSCQRWTLEDVYNYADSLGHNIIHIHEHFAREDSAVLFCPGLLWYDGSKTCMDCSFITKASRESQATPLGIVRHCEMLLFMK